jgi:sugar-specific transcriptional regulator TrmB
VVARRVQQADQKIEEATADLQRMKAAVEEKLATVNKSVDKVTSSVDKVADKVSGVTEKVTEKFDKVEERLTTKFKETEAELLSRVDKNRAELEEKYGAFDADGDGDVSAGEATDAIKKDPTNIYLWIGAILAFLGIGGKKTGGKISEMIYNSGRKKRLGSEEIDTT